MQNSVFKSLAISEKYGVDFCIPIGVYFCDLHFSTRVSKQGINAWSIFRTEITRCYNINLYRTLSSRNPKSPKINMGVISLHNLWSQMHQIPLFAESDCPTEKYGDRKGSVCVFNDRYPKISTLEFKISQYRAFLFFVFVVTLQEYGDDFMKLSSSLSSSSILFIASIALSCHLWITIEQ